MKEIGPHVLYQGGMDRDFCLRIRTPFNIYFMVPDLVDQIVFFFFKMKFLVFKVLNEALGLDWLLQDYLFKSNSLLYSNSLIFKEEEKTFKVKDLVQ